MSLPRCLASLLLVAAIAGAAPGQTTGDMPDGWSRDISSTPASRPDTAWFRNAKFGIFMHWGLYSEAANVWDGKNYYGSGEWLMNRAKIPVKKYETLATTFNPVHFNADDWAQFVHDAGAKYLVITAKHHEGFAMYKSAASPYNIVDATPYKKDPMLPLADACRARGVGFGFYYSQYLDWHEQNGGGNTWDFNKADKNIKQYYADKSMPQIHELASNYGPLSVLWFDMPGGLTREETATFVSNVRKLQPNCLISSRVGQGLGDFSDLGDSELPATPIDGPWEALFTHSDSWGYQANDHNFKSPRDVVQLLATVAARGGNLILNVGPDGDGNIPQKSLDYLRTVGKWLDANGESIYGTTAAPFPDQPWGVATSKPQKLFLHLFRVPRGHRLYVPNFTANVSSISILQGTQSLTFEKQDNALSITLPDGFAAPLDSVITIAYTGTLTPDWRGTPAIISQQFDALPIDASTAGTSGNAKVQAKTTAQYFGNWKHDTLITSQQLPADTATFHARFLDKGDYRVILDYACPPEAKAHEGAIDFTLPGATTPLTYTFQTLVSGPYDNHEPLTFVHHVIGILSVPATGEATITVHPAAPLPKEIPSLFWLKKITLEPV